MSELLMKWKSRRFVRNEDGSILIFVLFVFTTMALVGGTAIDIARHETMRSTMQYNLDRAVLAAASLKQSKVPDAVVEDYMSKVTSLEPVSVTTTYDTGLNFRTVSATATAELDTMFMNMAGIDSLPITVTSSAEERIPKLEISLVLDVSGSMETNGKLSNLKVAAKEFVSTMLTGVDPNQVSISIVPFSSTVTPSTALFEQLNVDVLHDYSTCLDFEDSDFATVAIDPQEEQRHAIFASLSGDLDDLNQEKRTCYTEENFQILAYSGDESVLDDKIDGLEAKGWTAGQQGIKWGAALLDPSFRPVVQGLIDGGEVISGFSAVPAEYSDVETLKVLIFMGDGANTYEFRFGEEYREGASDLWEVQYEEQVFSYAYYRWNNSVTSTNEGYCAYSWWICVYEAGPTKSRYYLDHPNQSRFYDSKNDQWISDSTFYNLENTLDGWVSSDRLSWGQAWGHMPAIWYGNKIGNYNAYYDLVYYTGREHDEADTAMSLACNAVRDAGIVTYTIGFETDSSTSAKLRDCASTPSHYYDAVGLQISEVFAQIAASIQKLKLTQ